MFTLDNRKPEVIPIRIEMQPGASENRPAYHCRSALSSIMTGES